MSQPKSQRKRQQQQVRTRRHEDKRRDVRNAYRPRTTGQGKRYISPAEALAMYLMPNYEIARANQFLQALRRVQQRKAAA